MSAEQLAAFALLGMQKSPSPSLGEIRKMEADNLKTSCSDGNLFPIASAERTLNPSLSGRKYNKRRADQRHMTGIAVMASNCIASNELVSAL